MSEGGRPVKTEPALELEHIYSIGVKKSDTLIGTHLTPAKVNGAMKRMKMPLPNSLMEAIPYAEDVFQFLKKEKNTALDDCSGEDILRALENFVCCSVWKTKYDNRKIYSHEALMVCHFHQLQQRQLAAIAGIAGRAAKAYGCYPVNEFINLLVESNKASHSTVAMSEFKRLYGLEQAPSPHQCRAPYTVG